MWPEVDGEIFHLINPINDRLESTEPPKSERKMRQLCNVILQELEVHALCCDPVDKLAYHDIVKNVTARPYQQLADRLRQWAPFSLFSKYKL